MAVVLFITASPTLAEIEPNTHALKVSEDTKATFMEAWQAASVGDLGPLSEAITKLQVQDPNTPLLSYLRFEQLRQTVDQQGEQTMTRFLAQHRDWSFATRLELTWLRALARRGQIDVVNRYLEQTGQQINDPEIRCHQVSAQAQQNPNQATPVHAKLLGEIESLWRVGRSQHKACDRAFRWWRAQGMPSHAVAWSRFVLAIEQGERSLAGYLQRYLDQEQRVWASRWLMMARYPHRALAQARDWPDHPKARTMVVWGLTRMASSDWARASGHWSNLKTRFQWSDPTAASIEREIALFQAVALEPESIERIDQLPASAIDTQILGWRARVAMAHGQWEEVLTSIQAMPARVQLEGRWRYWRGRALAEMGRPDAVLAYASISGEANYYGFLAAKKLGQPLSLCPETLAMDPSVHAQWMDEPELIRAFALFQVGLLGDARATWYRWVRRLPDTQQHQAALLAASMDWHDRAIATLASSGMLRAYELRFPLQYQALVMQHTERHGLDPALVYGLMRAESALQPDATSPVGAMGLLQLMPATARGVARRQNIALPNSRALYEPPTNVALGVAHLAELQEKFDHDWRLVAAAYNAGSGAVERWLAREILPRPLPADVWIETLPFFETRDYVPRVLAFATIYEWQLGRSPEVLSRHVAKTTSTPTQGFVCATP